jgi:hypothetical protein
VESSTSGISYDRWVGGGWLDRCPVNDGETIQPIDERRIRKWTGSRIFIRR